MQKELEEACRDTRGMSPEEIREGSGPVYQATLPSKPTQIFVSYTIIINIIGLKFIECKFIKHVSNILN